VGIVAAGVVMGVTATAAPAPPAGTPQEVVFFTAEGPVRVRLAVTVNGRPAEQQWRAGVDGLFAFCDRNGDGTLDDKERAHFVNRGNQNGFVEINGSFYSIGRLPQLAFSSPTADREAFAAAFKAAGLGPLRTTVRAPQTDSPKRTDALFAKLDTNQDGKLSVEELKAARTRLAPLDTDEDEWLTADELLERPSADANPFGRRQRMMNTAAPVAADTLLAAPGQSVTAKQLLTARDKDKDGSLTAAELGCSAAALGDLDADGDGRLDTEELAAWLRRPADLTLRVALAERASVAGWATHLQAKLTGKTAPLTVAPGGRFTPAAETDGSLGLRTPSARVRFEADTTAADARRTEWKAGTATARTVFAVLTLGKGELERKVLEGNPNTAAALPFFDLADRDGDKKLTRAEMDGLMTVLDPLVNCRAEITLADLGRGLFELIDRDGDGRLSPRELHSAAGVVPAVGRGSGAVGRDDPPRGYTVATRQTSIDVLPANGGFVDVGFGPGRPNRRPAALPPNTPAWFAPMDRNGDGDVSAREFGGPPALFARMDADRDGLVGPDEAREFEKKTRPAATRNAGPAQTKDQPARANPSPGPR
jgi:Ca2+-binding EF-hand superfamily protein